MKHHEQIDALALRHQDGTAPRGNEPPPADGVMEITKSIVGDLQELIRAELGLAVAELSEKGRRLAAAASPIALGAVIALAGLVILLLAIAAALALVLPVWASLLIVAVASLVGGGAAIAIGAGRIGKADPVPKETVANVKRDAETIRKHV